MSFEESHNCLLRLLYLAGLLVLTIVLSTITARAEGANVSTTPLALSEVAEVWRAPAAGGSLAQARAAFSAGEYGSGAESPPSGMTPDVFWLRLDVVNETDTPLTRRVDMGAPYLAFAKVTLTNTDGDTTLLKDNRRQAWSDRLAPSSRLVSQGFTLAPKERATLWVGYAVDGSAALNIRLMSAQDLAREGQSRTILRAAFYTGVAVFAVISIGFLVVSWSWAQLFSFFFLIGLSAYTAQLEGLLFAGLWPNRPVWNAYASHYIGMLAVMSAVWAMQLYVSAKERHRIYFISGLVFIVCCAGFLVLPAVLPLVQIKLILGPVMLVFLILQLIGAGLALRNRLDGAGFLAAGVVGLIGYIGLFTLGSQVDGMIGPAARSALLRFGLLLECALFSLSMFRKAWVAQKAQALATQRATQAEQTLATMRHDLRQPVGTLRAAATESADPDTARRLEQSVEYLQSILDAPDSGAHVPRSENENGAASLYLDAMARMFETEARQKGVALRVLPSSLQVAGAPLAVMRVLSNLVGNAVEHSGSSRVVIGCRPAGPQTVRFVVADAGCGFDCTTLTGRQPSATPQGAARGLGLGIVRTIAKEAGLTIACRSTPHKLTMVEVTVPGAKTRL